MVFGRLNYDVWLVQYFWIKKKNNNNNFTMKDNKIPVYVVCHSKRA